MNNSREIPKFNLIREIPLNTESWNYNFLFSEELELDENLTINNLEKTELELCSLV